MTYTYDLNTNGVLILRCSAAEADMIRGLANEYGEYTDKAEYEALEHLLCNSE